MLPGPVPAYSREAVSVKSVEAAQTIANRPVALEKKKIRRRIVELGEPDRDNGPVIAACMT
jgi:hypothetical protein